MLEIDKFRHLHPGESLTESLREYERDFAKARPEKDVPPNPSPQHVPAEAPELFDAVKKKKKSS